MALFIIESYFNGVSTDEEFLTGTYYSTTTNYVLIFLATAKSLKFIKKMTAKISPKSETRLNYLDALFYTNKNPIQLNLNSRRNAYNRLL